MVKKYLSQSYHIVGVSVGVVMFMIVGFFSVIHFVNAAGGGGGGAVADPNPGISADMVLGQTTFAASSANMGGSITTSTLSGPTTVYVSATNTYVVDAQNHRVLIWTTTTPANGAAANIVLGQGDFGSGASNQGGSIASNTLSFPRSVYTDGAKVYVTDVGNNRVLIWNTSTPISGSGANIVLGQADFTSGSANRGGSVSSSTLDQPYGIFSNGSKIFVTDPGSHRALIWNTTTPISGSGANVVLGQADFLSGSADRGSTLTSSTLDTPASIFADSSKIYVSDTGNKRILIWNTLSPTTASGADAVLGQTDFTTDSFTLDASHVNLPQTVFSDGSNIFVADGPNSRVMIWTTTTPTNGVAASAIVGSSIFTSDGTTGGFHNLVSTTTLNSPTGVSYRNGKLYVADTSFNRVLRFDMNAATPGTPTVSVNSTSSLGVTVSSATNPAMTQYAIFESGTATYLQANGALGASPIWQTTSTWTSPVSITGLNVNQQYTLRLIGRYVAGLNTATSSASSLFTLANAASAPTVTVSSTMALNISINVNSNSTNTTYAVFNTTTGNFLNALGASTSTAVYSSSSTLGTSFTATGLTTNTPYQFVVIARNGDSTNAATSSASTAVYTLASVPSSVAAAAASNSSITVTWSGDATNYYVENTTASTNSGWTSTTTYTFTGLTCATSYTFQVKGRNGDLVETANASSVSATTSACAASSSGSSSGGGSVSPNAPTIPADSANTNNTTEKTQSFSSGSSGSFSLGNETHTVTVLAATDEACTATIQSTPITVTLQKAETRNLDTNKDGQNDLRVTYNGLVLGKPQFTFVELAQVNRPGSAIVINGGAAETHSRTAQLTFTVSGAVQMAISHTEDFAGVAFVPYQASMSWGLTPGNGLKKVYVKFRSAAGGVTSAMSSILLSLSPSVPSVSGTVVVNNSKPIVSTTGPSIPLKFTRNLYMGSRGKDVVALQQFLRELGYFTWKQNTGLYGSATASAVRQYQKAHKIVAVGYVGPVTRAALNVR